jgi:polysaccharide pyruvyl transferase WcaK-like protein
MLRGPLEGEPSISNDRPASPKSVNLVASKPARDRAKVLRYGFSANSLAEHWSTMKVAFWGNFGTHNLGNECTLHAMLANARRFLPNAELVSVCAGPDDTRERHRVEAVPMARGQGDRVQALPRALRQVEQLVGEVGDWLRVVRVMRGIDQLVVTGTGILTDSNEGPLGMPYQMFKWVAAARLCGHQVSFVSVGAERLNSPYKVRFMGWALELSGYRSYRDQLSKSRAERMTSHAASDPIYPDLAFSLPEGLTSDRAVPARDGKKTVAVGVYTVESGPDGMRAYIDTVGELVLWLLEQGYRTRIVIGDATYDQDARTNLRAWLAERGALERVIDEPAASFEELLEQLASVDLVIATRFHNVLLSLLLGKPVVSVSHMDKNDQLMAAMGLSAYCMPLANAQAPEIIARFRELEKNADELARQIRERNDLFRRQLDDQYRLIFEGRAATAGETA